MKKLAICLLVLMCAMAIVLSACSKKSTTTTTTTNSAVTTPAPVTTTTTPPPTTTTTDSGSGGSALDLLTVSYPLEELRAYFLPAHWDQLNPTVRLRVEDVSEAYPFELFREGGEHDDPYTEPYPYTVYRVEEGGYYYVFFWNGEVYFSLYLTAATRDLDLDALLAVQSLEELKALDDQYELPKYCSMPRTYTYLNADEVLMISYEDYSDSARALQHSILPRGEDGSCFGFILLLWYRFRRSFSYK